MQKKIEKDLISKLYRKAYLIRIFEELLLKLFSEGKLYGTTHTSIGQEGIPASLFEHLSQDDIVFSNHRCHGHYIGYGGPIDKLLAEIMGRDSGVCHGRGGSQHLHYKNFFTNGIQGGIVGNAVGAALSLKLNNSDNKIVNVFLGDGTLGEGLVYESLNFAVKHSLSIHFILEDNMYAQSTHSSLTLSSDILQRVKGFGIEASEISSNHALSLYTFFQDSVKNVRKYRKPFFSIVHTYRLADHSKGDDFRDINEINEWKKKDPIILLEKQLDELTINKIQKENKQIIQESLKYAESSKYGKIVSDRIYNIRDAVNKDNMDLLLQESQEGSLFVAFLNRSLHQILQKNKDVLILGEDLLDPYGGAFKVTKGLSTKFPKRVIPTAISEAGIIAWGVGLALFGKKPIVEIMFGDFLGLAFDQILNHATKYQWIYGDDQTLPLIIRTPMGGRRGYGPTHSQSIEKHFFGIPGLNVIAPCILLNPGKLLERCLSVSSGPVLFVENKIQYTRRLSAIKNNKFKKFDVKISKDSYPVFNLSLTNFSNPDCYIFCYGENIEIAMQVSLKLLIQNEINSEIIIPTKISPIEIDIFNNLNFNNKTVVTIEENSKQSSWGGEIISLISESFNTNNTKFVRIAALDLPIPSSIELEKQVLPNEKYTYEKILEIIG